MLTRAELMDKIGYKENDLINTNRGYMDVLEVDGDSVVLGFLAGGSPIREKITDFLDKFRK